VQTGVGHQDIDGSVFAEQVRVHVPYLFLAADISLQSDSITAFGVDLRNDLFGLIRCSGVIDRYPDSGSRQGLGDACADSRAGARNKSNLTPQGFVMPVPISVFHDTPSKFKMS